MSEELTVAAGDTDNDSERNVLLITYVLYGIGCFFILTAVAGVIINHVKLGELSRHGVAWSHHRWLMRTFWFGLLWSFISLILIPFGIGLLGYLVVWVWCFYRFVRGLVTFADRRPMPT